MWRRRHLRSEQRCIARCFGGSACARLSTDRDTQTKISANGDAKTEADGYACANANARTNANAGTDANARIVVVA